jgi:hypothetical protein
MAAAESPSSSADATDYGKLQRVPSAQNLLEKHKRRKVWNFSPRPVEDNEPQDWWFCSTAIPLLAATSGPLANVMSIAGECAAKHGSKDSG